MSIKKCRTDNGLKQKELAVLMEVKQSTVSMWESGAAYPTVEKLIKLARVLNCSVDDLLSTERDAESA